MQKLGCRVRLFGESRIGHAGDCSVGSLRYRTEEADSWLCRRLANKVEEEYGGSSKQGLVILRTRTLRGDVWLEREALPLMLSAKFGRRYAGTSTNCAAKGIASEFHALNHDQTPLRNQETKLATSKPSKVDRKQEKQSREMAAACWERREPTPMRELSCAGKKSTWEIGGTPPRHVLQGGDNVCFALLNGVRRKLSNSKEWFLVCASAGMHVCM